MSPTSGGFSSPGPVTRAGRFCFSRPRHPCRQVFLSRPRHPYRQVLISRPHLQLHHPRRQLRHPRSQVFSRTPWQLQRPHPCSQQLRLPLLNLWPHHPPAKLTPKPGFGKAYAGKSPAKEAEEALLGPRSSAGVRRSMCAGPVAIIAGA